MIAVLFPRFDHPAIEERYASWQSEMLLRREEDIEFAYYDPEEPASVASGMIESDHALIITECLVHYHPLDRAAGVPARLRTAIRTGHDPVRNRRAALMEVFTPRELESVLVIPSGLVQMQPLELRTSAEGPPTVLLHVARSTFTSVCLPLMKPG